MKEEGVTPSPHGSHSGFGLPSEANQGLVSDPNFSAKDVVATLTEEKLRRELVLLGDRAWWTQHLLSAVPALLLALTAWLSGFFDASSKNLSAEKALLEIEKVKRSDLDRQNSELAIQVNAQRREKEAVTALVQNGANVLVNLSEDDSYHVEYSHRQREYLDLSVFDVPEPPGVGSSQQWPRRRDRAEITTHDDDITIGELRYLKRVSSLKLNEVQLTPRRLAALESLSGLQSVRLEHCGLGDDRIGSLPLWPGVLELSLESNPCTKASRICELSRLRSLNLSHTHFGDVGLSDILRSCQNLEELSILNTRITDASAEALLQCEKLTRLNAGVQFSYDGLKRIVHCKSLRELYHSGTKMPESADEELRTVNAACRVRHFPDFSLISHPRTAEP